MYTILRIPPPSSSFSPDQRTAQARITADPCPTASPDQISLIAAGVQGQADYRDIKTAYAVRAPQNNGYFVGARIYDPGHETGTDPGVWLILGERNHPTSIMAIDDQAQMYTDFPDGGFASPPASMETDGAQAAQICARTEP